MNTFGKQYKLCSRKTIDLLFTEGNKLRVFPFSIHFKEIEMKEEKPFQLVFSAPKRKFKRAHDRNRIKRLMREAFRHKKLILEDALLHENKQMVLFVVYTHHEELPMEQLMKQTEKLLQTLKDRISHESLS